MILTLLAILATAYGTWKGKEAVQGFARSRRRKLLAGINHFDGLVLPAVDDPSWKQSGSSCKWAGCNRYIFTLGKIRCCMDHGVLVDDMDLRHTWPTEVYKLREYAAAVRRAYIDRTVQESIDDYQHPQLEAIQ